MATAAPIPNRHQIIFRSLEGFLIRAIGEKEYSGIKTVLEFGCGKTGFAGDYLRPGRVSYGVDLHDHTDHWRKLGVLYRMSDGITIPLADSSIDLVVAHSVVEHVENLPNSLREINRVLKPGGIGYITVSPLYFSPNGSHIRSLPDWEHLRPGSKYYMMQQPIDREGAYLNKLTMSELLGMIGALPWNIMRMERFTVDNEIPDWLTGFPVLDLITREFRLVVRKAG